MYLEITPPGLPALFSLRIHLELIQVELSQPQKQHHGAVFAFLTKQNRPFLEPILFLWQERETHLMLQWTTSHNSATDLASGVLVYTYV